MHWGLLSLAAGPSSVVAQRVSLLQDENAGAETSLYAEFPELVVLSQRAPLPRSGNICQCLEILLDVLNGGKGHYWNLVGRS